MHASVCVMGTVFRGDDEVLEYMWLSAYAGYDFFFPLLVSTLVDELTHCTPRT